MPNKVEPPMKDWIKKNKIANVECIVPDLAGAARGKVVPASKLIESAELRLPQSIFLQGVNGHYPALIKEKLPCDDDMLLLPDATTIRHLPWAETPTAQIIHDCVDKEGNHIPFSPRYVLRKVLDLYHAEGWKPVVAPELEFYLVAANPDPTQPLTAPFDRTGRTEKEGQSYSLEALHEFSALYQTLDQYCTAQNLKIDGLIHEEGIAQMEVNLLHGDPLNLADQTFLYKRTIREAAFAHGLCATFMAKPLEGQPGNAMHIHQSIVDMETGKNLFSTLDGKPNDLLLSHIAGLQKFQPEAMALVTPTINSYRRIVRDMAAPINFHWGYDNRTTGFRIPDNKPNSMRIENRLSAADVNPYIAIAASLACGFIGMKQSLKPSKPLLGNAYDEPLQVSRDWYGALNRLSDCEALNDILGEEFIEVYTAVKETEFDDFLNQVSPWEREHLLSKV
jgi:glutamine synthetase